MKIGLIDVDGNHYPNLPLMKLSAYHKARGDHVEWYYPLTSGHMDRVYMSKVFSFTPDYMYFIDADEVIKGGTGYAIKTIDGKEHYDKARDVALSEEIEHMYPDYTIYNADTAYGFLSRGCPRGCSFCHVKPKEGNTHKVADLKEFWAGQKNIELLDPNILACNEWEDLLGQLINSKATVNFSQGLDIRLMTDKKAEMLSKIKVNTLHFAWDRYEDKDLIQPKFKAFRKISKIRNKDLVVYVLCGDKSRDVLPGDLERIYWLRDNGFAPYIMLYDKQSLPDGADLRQLQRWVNMRAIFWKVNTFDDYKRRDKE